MIKKKFSRGGLPWGSGSKKGGAPQGTPTLWCWRGTEVKQRRGPATQQLKHLLQRPQGPAAQEVAEVVSQVGGLAVGGHHGLHRHHEEEHRGWAAGSMGMVPGRMCCRWLLLCCGIAHPPPASLHQLRHSVPAVGNFGTRSMFCTRDIPHFVSTH